MMNNKQKSTLKEVKKKRDYLKKQLDKIHLKLGSTPDNNGLDAFFGMSGWDYHVLKADIKLYNKILRVFDE